MEAASISIIIPTYNQCQLLAETLNSVRAQTVGMNLLEVVVVDDGSSDGTEEMVRGLAKSGVRYIRQDRQGSSAARNRGLAETESPYVLSLDHDDLLTPHYCQEALDTLRAHPEAGVAWMNFSVFGVNPVDDFAATQPNQHDPLGFGSLLRQLGKSAPSPAGEDHNQAKERLTLGTAETMRLLSTCGPQSNSALVFRRECLAGWNPRMRLADDWGAVFKSWTRSPFSMVAVQRVCWHKRVAQHNTSKGRGLEMEHRRREEMENILSEYRGTLPESSFRTVRAELAQNYLVLGYSDSQRGALGSALRWYGRSFIMRPTVTSLWRGVKAVGRKLAARATPGKSPPATGEQER